MGVDMKPRELPKQPSVSVRALNPGVFGVAQNPPPVATPTQPPKLLRKRRRDTYEDHPDRPLPNAEPERDQAATLDQAVRREKEGAPSVTVRFIGYRVRPLDPDNFAGSVKDLLDGLRHAALIPGDEPWRIRLETEQVCVRTYAQERTVIEIETP